MYQIKKISIANMQDFEITELLSVCAELFGTQLRNYGIQAFIYLLRQKYNFVTDEKILNACTNFASSQEQSKRFSPALLSHILINANKDQQSEYKSYEATEEQKAQYKQQWIEAVCLDFDDYCNKIPPSRIFVWRFLAKQLKAKGIIFEQEYESANEKDSKAFSFQSEFKPLCLKIFNDLAMQGRHIANYIKWK